MTLPTAVLNHHLDALSRHLLTLVAVEAGPMPSVVTPEMRPWWRRSWWHLSAPGTRNNSFDITFGPGGIVLHGDYFTRPIGTDHKDLSWFVNVHIGAAGDGVVHADYFLGKFLSKVYDHDQAMIDVLVRAKDPNEDEEDRKRWQAAHDDDPESEDALMTAMESVGFSDVYEYGLGMIYPIDESARLLAARARFEQLYRLHESWNVGDTVAHRAATDVFREWTEVRYAIETAPTVARKGTEYEQEPTPDPLRCYPDAAELLRRRQLTAAPASESALSPGMVAMPCPPSYPVEAYDTDPRIRALGERIGDLERKLWAREAADGVTDPAVLAFVSRNVENTPHRSTYLSVLTNPEQVQEARAAWERRTGKTAAIINFTDAEWHAYLSETVEPGTFVPNDCAIFNMSVRVRTPGVWDRFEANP